MSTQPEKIVLICVGLVGSGKSTFAESLQHHFPQYVRCNQDDLGDRREVESLARKSLRQGHSVCIDRTNFDAAQRAHWIKFAREFGNTSIWILHFDTSIETCKTRLRTRTGHPTIQTAELGLEVLAKFSSIYSAPTPVEGYDRILSLGESHQLETYTKEDITAILQRIRDSPRVVKPRYSNNRGGGASSRGSYYSRGGAGYRPPATRGGGGGGGRGAWGSGGGAWGISSTSAGAAAACGDRADIHVARGPPHPPFVVADASTSPYSVRLLAHPHPTLIQPATTNSTEKGPAEREKVGSSS